VGQISTSDWLTALLLAIFLGTLGIHRFYVKKIGTGIIMILLCWTGISTIWSIIDIIMIATGKFKDKSGRVLSKTTA
jgi:TM2 domain-containing membrane protein YozV